MAVLSPSPYRIREVEGECIACLSQVPYSGHDDHSLLHALQYKGVCGCQREGKLYSLEGKSLREKVE